MLGDQRLWAALQGMVKVNAQPKQPFPRLRSTPSFVYRREPSCRLDLALEDRESHAARLRRDLVAEAAITCVVLAYCVALMAEAGLEQRPPVFFAKADLCFASLCAARFAAAVVATGSAQRPLWGLVASVTALVVASEALAPGSALHWLPPSLRAAAVFVVRACRFPVVFASVSSLRRRLGMLRSLRRTGTATPAERVVAVLKTLQRHPALEQTVLDELSWIVDILASEQLYSISVEEMRRVTNISDEMQAYLAAEGLHGAIGQGGGRRGGGDEA